MPFYFFQPIVKFLVEEAGASWNVPDVDEWVPLHLAAYHGHLDIVKYLV